MKKEDMDALAGYWQRREAEEAPMERQALLAEMERFILAHNTCALATGTGTFVRCTPIEYTYRDGCFWLFSEGGLKFRALADNENVCLAIYDPYQGFGSAAGMQISGIAALMEAWSQPYLDILDYKKIKPEALKRQPHQLQLIRVTPKRIDFLNGAFRKLGVDLRQHIEF